MAKIDRKLDDHERRITSVEAELHETNLDVSLLADIVLRARKRARASLRRRIARRR
jgi:hypothetical protein